MSHIQDREIKTWGSYGKNGDEPLTIRLIKDLSDEHLENIIPFIKRHVTYYTSDTLQLMMREKYYRELMRISVPEYSNINIKTYKFFKKN